MSSLLRTQARARARAGQENPWKRRTAKELRARGYRRSTREGAKGGGGKLEAFGGVATRLSRIRSNSIVQAILAMLRPQASRRAA